MSHHHNKVTMKGQPIELSGECLHPGSSLPNVSLTANDLSSVNLSSMKGKVCVMISVPSLDTPVCDVEAKRFNQEVSRLSSNVNLAVVSMDLPFAQKRWCGAAGVERITTLSDHASGAFGQAFGVMIPSLRLLARAVYVFDSQGVLQYEELVPEVTAEPNYEAAISAIKKLL